MNIRKNLIRTGAALAAALALTPAALAAGPSYISQGLPAAWNAPVSRQIPAAVLTLSLIHI